MYLLGDKKVNRQRLHQHKTLSKERDLI